MKKCIKAIQDLLFYLRMLKAHNIKLYNPHCPRWNNCGGSSLNKDCFMCEYNLKGSEQYVIEKLISKIIKEMVE